MMLAFGPGVGLGPGVGSDMALVLSPTASLSHHFRLSYRLRKLRVRAMLRAATFATMPLSPRPILTCINIKRWFRGRAVKFPLQSIHIY